MNTTNHRVYTDKFVMKALNLRNLDNAGNTDERVIHWARIFKAKTLNELEELAGEQEDFKKMVFELKKLTEDEKIKQQIEARADYESRIATARGAGRREGETEKAETIFLNLLYRGIEINEAIEITGISKDRAEELATAKQI